MILIGTGIGLTFPGVIAATLSAVRNPADIGAASALVLGLRMVGMSIANSTLSSYATLRVNQLVQLVEGNSPVFASIPPADYPTRFTTAYISGVVHTVAEMALIGAVILGIALLGTWALKIRQTTAARVVFSLLALSLILIVPRSAQAQAQPDSAPLEQMAQLIPADVDSFAAFNISETYISRLDTLYLNAAAQSTDLPHERLTETICQALNLKLPLPINCVSAILDFLGDSLGVGMSGTQYQLDDDPTNDHLTRIYLVAERDPRKSIELFLTLLGVISPLNRLPDPQEGYTLYRLTSPDALLGISDQYVYVALNADALPLPISASLAESESFKAAVGELPRQDYGIVAYADLPALLTPFVQNPRLLRAFSSVGLDMTQLSPAALGFAVTDEPAPLIDIAQLRQGTPSGDPLDLSLLGFVPPHTSMFAQSRDLDGLIRSVAGLYSALLSGAETQEDVQARINLTVMQILGVDLQQDILSWAGSSNFLFFANDATLLPDATIPPEFGFVVETHDPQRARQFAAALGQRLPQLFPSMTMRDETIAGITTSVVQIPDPARGSVEIALGATEDIFFVAPYAQAETLANALAARSAPDVLTGTASDWLAQPRFVFSIDQDGVRDLTNAARQLLNISSTSADALAQQIIRVLQEAITQSTISVSVNAHDTLLLRVTATLLQ